MVFSHSDAIQFGAVGEDKAIRTGKINSNARELKRKKKVEWKPFHLLLIIYSLIAVVGIIYRINS